MLYLFTGNNDYLVREEVLRWKSGFAQKHGDENITHITTLDINSKNTIGESMLSRSIFAEKRLLIIDGFPFSGEKAFSGAADLEKLILESLESVPDEVLIVFSSVNPDKRKTGYKTLSKKAEVKNFNIDGDDRVYHILSKKYGSKVEAFALKRLIMLKGGDLQKSISEIDKLLIIPLGILSGEERLGSSITVQDIEKYIIPEFEESIFVFIDTILTKNRKKIFSELSNLINYSNLYAIYQSILANIRVFLYIELLKKQKKSPKEIGDILKLGNRAFLINKQHKSSFKSISQLYFDLLDFDKNMKTGKFISSDEDDLKKELERIFLKFVA